MDDNIPLDGVFHGYDELDNGKNCTFCFKANLKDEIIGVDGEEIC